MDFAILQPSRWGTSSCCVSSDANLLTPSGVFYCTQALSGVERLVVALEGGVPLGFMGAQAGRLEMLFLAPEARGRGLGGQLLEEAIARYGVEELTVNEQNPDAVGFYEHLGFRTYKRTELDEEGRPYPLLYMRREATLRE